LNSLLVFVAHLDVHVILFYQGSEFGFVIKDIETVSVELDYCMVSRYWYICNSDLAIMSSSKLNSYLGDVLDHHHTFGLFASTLKNYVVSFRFLNRQHLDDFVVLSFNNYWKLGLAYFTFKFFKIIMQCPSNNFFFNFNIYPLEEAL
jgi:hypothetical protein